MFFDKTTCYARGKNGMVAVYNGRHAMEMLTGGESFCGKDMTAAGSEINYPKIGNSTSQSVPILSVTP